MQFYIHVLFSETNIQNSIRTKRRGKAECSTRMKSTPVIVILIILKSMF